MLEQAGSESALLLPIHRPAIEAAHNPAKAAERAKMTGKLALALVGLGSIALYIKPAGDCATMDTCGLWLTNLTSEQAATAIFTMGGIDFSGISFLQGYLSFDRTVEYIKAQKSKGAKIVKASGVVIFALSQTTPILLASIGTQAAAWQTIVTVSGSLSSSLFGTINLVDNDIPFALSRAKRVVIIPYHMVIDHFSPLSDHERWRRQQILHYTRQQSLFIERMESQFRGLVANAGSLQIDGHPDPLTFLFQQAPLPETRLEYAIHKAGQVIAPFVAASFLSVLVSNTFNVMQKFIPYKPLQILLTSFFSLSQVNSHFKITSKAVTGPLDTLVSLITRKPVHSMSFQLRPKTTSLALFLSTVLSALSYALIDILFEKQFPGADIGPRRGFRIAAIVNIDVYHIAGLFHLYQLGLSLLTKDEKEKYLFHLQNKEIPRWRRMSVENFMTFVANHREQLERLQIETFQGEEPPAPLKEPESNPSCWGSFLNFFTRKKPEPGAGNSIDAAPGLAYDRPK